MSPNSDYKLKADSDATPVFTPRDVHLIAISLPDTVDSRRRELLAEILPEWSYFELGEHLRLQNPITPERSNLLQSIGQCAADLLHALKAVDEVDREVLAVEMALVAGESLLASGWTEINKLNTRIAEEASFLSNLEEAARNLKRGPGQPRKIAARLVMMDIAAIFEWLTDKRPTREGDVGFDAESDPPFWRFAAAIWPVVFGKGNFGLSSAMKNWAEERREHGYESAVMFNIHMRRPEWGIFGC
jgi:hypothetical protein